MIRNTRVFWEFRFTYENFIISYNDVQRNTNYAYVYVKWGDPLQIYAAAKKYHTWATLC